MPVRVRLSFLLFFLIEVSFGQAVTQARRRLQEAEENTFQLVMKLGEIQKDFFWNQNPSLQASDLNQFSQLCKKQLQPSRQEPDQSYFLLVQQMIIHAALLQEFRSGWQPDSALVWRTKALASGESLLTVAAALDHSVSVYCLMNKLNKPEDKSSIPSFLREEWSRLEYLLEIQKILFPVVEAERKCLNNFLPDSVSSAEKRRLDFTGLVSVKTQTMKNYPPLKGDRFVKSAALNSLYQFAMEAKNDLPHLEKFLEAEEEFILIHEKSKSAEKLSTEETEGYRKAVKKYNADIRAANELVKELQKKRDTHLRAFFAAQQAFLEDNLRVFQE